MASTMDCGARAPTSEGSAATGMAARRDVAAGLHFGSESTKECGLQPPGGLQGLLTSDESTATVRAARRGEIAGLQEGSGHGQSLLSPRASLMAVRVSVLSRLDYPVLIDGTADL